MATFRAAVLFYMVTMSYTVLMCRQEKNCERAGKRDSKMNAAWATEKRREMHLINLPAFHYYFRIVPWSFLKRVVQSSGNRREKIKLWNYYYYLLLFSHADVKKRKNCTSLPKIKHALCWFLFLALICFHIYVQRVGNMFIFKCIRHSTQNFKWCCWVASTTKTWDDQSTRKRVLQMYVPKLIKRINTQTHSLTRRFAFITSTFFDR